MYERIRPSMIHRTLKNRWKLLYGQQREFQRGTGRLISRRDEHQKPGYQGRCRKDRWNEVVDLMMKTVENRGSSASARGCYSLTTNHFKNQTRGFGSRGSAKKTSSKLETKPIIKQAREILKHHPECIIFMSMAC